MRYWITLHWPHSADPAHDVPWNVYLQHRWRRKGQRLSPGEKVAFYETGSGPRFVRKGTKVIEKLTRGRQAAVGVAEVTGNMRPRPPDVSVLEYEDGTTQNWGWEVPCGSHRWGKPVPLGAVLGILNRGTIRVAGGIIEMDKSQYEELVRRLGL